MRGPGPPSGSLLTALVRPPRRLVYLSSGMHRGGDPDLGDLQWRRRPWSGSQAYADSKLLDVVLAFYHRRPVATHPAGRGA